ncbi:hypothetical protein AMECASPLE_035400, partial [Ameca splendens]
KSPVEKLFLQAESEGRTKACIIVVSARMMESNSIMNSPDVEMQKVVVADLIRLSPDERDVLNQFDLATCDERIQ